MQGVILLQPAALDDAGNRGAHGHVVGEDEVGALRLVAGLLVHVLDEVDGRLGRVDKPGADRAGDGDPASDDADDDEVEQPGGNSVVSQQAAQPHQRGGAVVADDPCELAVDEVFGWHA